MNSLQLINSLELSLIYSLVAFSVYLSFRIINFTDLTIDGSFALGCSVMAASLNQDLGLGLAIILSIAAGFLSGMVTAYLNIKYKIMEILSGILTMTALYSINLRIMGQPNISLMNKVESLSENEIFWIIFIIVVLITIILILFLNTEIGLALKSIGENPKFSNAVGININQMKLITLAICNSLVSLAGGLLVLMQNFSDIAMGNGTIIIGLASVIIAEKISCSFLNKILALIIGTIIYRMIILLALNADFLNLEITDLNLLSSALLASIIIIPKYFRKEIRC